MNKFIISLSIALSTSLIAFAADKIEPIKYGNFDSWVTRNIHESAIIGGDTKQVYEIGPEKVINGSEPYVNLGGSPWATSNVMAKVCGITKTSNAVYPAEHQGHGRCARLTTHLERCKAIGIINIDVLVAGTIFLGRMFEPIKSTKDPYTKMEMGIPFTRRPKALQYDYCLTIPAGNSRLYSSGFGSKKLSRAPTRPRSSSYCSDAGRMPTAISTPNVSAQGVNCLTSQAADGKTPTGSPSSTATPRKSPASRVSRD